MKQYFAIGKSGSILLFASWFGLFFGYAEMLLQAFRKFFLHRVIYHSQHFLWMIPLMLLILFLAIGLVILLLSHFWIQLASLKVIAFLFLLLGIMAVYYAKPKINIYAAFILGLGLSFQLSRYLDRHSSRFGRVVVLTLPWMLSGVLVTFSVMWIFYP